MQAANALHQGNPDEALPILRSILTTYQKNKRANKLLLQIESDPVQLLGEKHFIYQIKQGESLSIFAKRYLNDPFMFFALARYNDVNIPGKIEVGHKLKIPGLEPISRSQSINEKKMPETPENLSTTAAITTNITNLDEERLPTEAAVLITEPSSTTNVNIKQLYDNNDYQAVLTSARAVELNVQQKQWVEGSALSLIKQLNEDGKPSNAMAVYYDATKLLGNIPSLATISQTLSRHIQAQDLFAKASATQDRENQLTMLQQAQTLYPKLASENNKYQAMISTITAHYHKQAMLALRQQKLDLAISLWDKVLSVDKHNELAIIHRARAEALKNKLQSID